MLLHVAVGHTETLKRSWSDGQTNFGWHVAVKRESPRFICGECQSITDRPMVVTHLASEQTTKGKATATLPEPLAIHDSAGVTLDAQVVSALVWRDIYGQPVGAHRGQRSASVLLSPDSFTLQTVDQRSSNARSMLQNNAPCSIASSNARCVCGKSSNQSRGIRRLVESR